MTDSCCPLHPYKPSIFIVDDHPLIRSSFSELLAHAGYAIAGEAGSLEQAQAMLPQFFTEQLIIILDLSLNVTLPDGTRKSEDGIDLVPWLSSTLSGCSIDFKSQDCPVRVLIFSAFENVPRIQEAVDKGVRGFVSKTSVSEDVLAAIHAVCEGQTFMDKNMVRKIIASKDVLDSLTTRERNILIEIQNMLTNEQIAEKLGLTVRTVENYISRLYEKTGATTRADLIKL